MKITEMISSNRADCSGCEACANICPKNAVKMTRDAEGFAYPKINPELCIKCGRCDSTCPALNFKKKNLAAFPEVFAAINPDEKIRRHSSSGGVFTALSEIILQSGGVIFGAAFDKNWHVIHTCARTLEELENLRGSKYVQSKIGDVYRQIKDALKSKKVLFSGTPCQCAGLKSFLGKDFDNLLTVDLICHGTPSPAVWENYIGDFAHNNDIAHVNFRSKRNGWVNYHVEINFFDTVYYARPINSDIYGKLFLNDLTLRPSCFDCKFKFPNGQSDLTLGDAWGIQKFAPEIFDNRGTSVVFIHTDKGRNFFEQTTLIKRQVKFIDVVMNNPAFIIPFSADERRENFFVDFANANDKFAVIQKYFYQDNSTLRQKAGEQNQRIFMQSYRAIAAQVAKNFKENILVITLSQDKNTQEILANFFNKEFANCGIYILFRNNNGQIVYRETFSSLNFPLKNSTDAISALIDQLNIAGIFVEDNFESYSPHMNNWLKNCKLPFKTFSLKTE